MSAEAADPVVAHARAILERSSRTFARAAALLSRREGEGACLLYAWCRYCDDRVDGQIMGQGTRDPTRSVAARRAVLSELRTLTREALDGRPPAEPVYHGIVRVVREYGVPEGEPFEVLDGMAMDVEGKAYPTIDDLLVYCRRVAGVVAVMMARIMGLEDEEPLRRADNLGRAFQLTNTARDVMDDASDNRVYLPLDWLREAGVPPGRVLEPEHRAAVARVVRRILDRADALYASVDRGLGPLPFRSAWAVAAGRGIYADLGHRIRRRGPAAWDGRVVVPDSRKAYWIARGFARAALQRLAHPLGSG